MQQPPPQLVDRIGLEKLAALPQATLRLMQACNDPKAEMDAIRDIIATDSGLTSRVVQVANSPLYGQWGRLTELRRMLVVLGIGTVKTIAVTSGVLELFSRFAPARSQLLDGFWRQSLWCAQVARALAEKVPGAAPEEAYLVGLLHKVGQLVLLNGDPELYATLVTVPPQRRSARERELFGIDHLELGAWLVERWRLGGFCGDAIRYQHEATEQMLDAPPLVRVLNLAARLCDPALRPDATTGAARLVGAAADDLPGLLERSQEAVERTAEAYGIDLDPAPAAAAPAAAPFPPERALLAQTVRDTALSDHLKSAMQEQTAETPPWLVIRRFLGLLFGLEQAEIFLLDGRHLRGMATDEDPQQIGTLTIAMEPGRSLLVEALSHETCMDSFRCRPDGRGLSVLDRQLIRHCGRSGIMALPMLAQGLPVGVVAAGAEPSTLDGFGPYLGLLRLFLAEAAALILRRRDEQEQRRLLLAEGQAQAMLAARKIRHEANNPLGIISNYLHLLGMKLGEDNPVREEIDILHGEIERVGSILLGLTERMGEQPAADGGVDVNDLISRLNTVLGASLFQTRGVDAELDLDRRLPRMRGNPDKLKQILLNLLKNAAEAMPEGGRLLLSSRAALHADLGPCVEIRVRDNGPGLPEAVQARLFQPVESSKGGQHAGLGLSISAQLARELKGSLQCRSGRDGTEFLLLLPANSHRTK